MRLNYQPKNFPPSSQVFSQSDLPHNVRLWRFFVLSCFAMTSNTARWIKDVCSITWKILAQIWRTLKQKSAQLVVFTTRYADFGGERGIRTPGTSQYAGFQDRCIRPLCHLSNRGNAIDVVLQSQWITIPLCFISGCKVTLFSSYLQIFGLLFSSIGEKTLVSTHFTASEAARNTSISRRRHKNMQAYFVLSSVCSNSE